MKKGGKGGEGREGKQTIWKKGEEKKKTGCDVMTRDEMKRGEKTKSNRQIEGYGHGGKSGQNSDKSVKMKVRDREGWGQWDRKGKRRKTEDIIKKGGLWECCDSINETSVEWHDQNDQNAYKHRNTSTYMHKSNLSLSLSHKHTLNEETITVWKKKTQKKTYDQSTAKKICIGQTGQKQNT